MEENDKHPFFKSDRTHWFLNLHLQLPTPPCKNNRILTCLPLISGGHRTGKGQFSFYSQRKAIPKNAQTAAHLHSSHTLVMFKILQARLQQYVNCELPDVQAGFRKGRGTRDQIAICWIIKKAESSRKHLFLLY